MQSIGWVIGAACLHAAGVYADVLRVPEDYPTLAAAAAVAQPGDEIVLGPGEWEGQVEFASFGISIRGRGADLTRIVPPSAPTSQPLLGWSATEAPRTPQGDSASLSGVTVDGYRGGDPASQSSYSALVYATGTGAETFTIEDCVLTGCYLPNELSTRFGSLDRLEVRGVVFDEVSGEEGCLYAPNTNEILVDRCSFIRNGGYGSPLRVFGSQSVVLRNSLFTGTSCMFTTIDRAAAQIFADEIRIESCTFGLGGPDVVRGNDLYAHLELRADQIDIVACAFADEPMFGQTPPSNAVFVRCVGLGVPPGSGNIVADPQFVNPGSPGPDGVWRSDDDDPGDLTPAPGSPLLDAASGDGFDAFDLDTYGNLRLSDLPGVVNTGSGSLRYLDIGAIERPGGSGPCPADTNADGAVTPADYNAWILAYNNRSPACDQNNDGACTPADYNAWILNFNNGCD